LVAAASAPGVDPCDVACEAMPACLVGDLTAADIGWLTSHTESCGYCAREMGRYERVGGVLDKVCDEACCADAGAPPEVVLPRAPAARYGRVKSPVGPLFVAVSEAGLCEIDFADHVNEAAFRRRLAARGFAPESIGGGELNALQACDKESIAGVARQLTEYFGGQRDRFELPLDFSGVSPFTRDVLAATAEVPFGRLETYQGIAQRVGKPGASRAVGNALGRNPIPVVVPCHRVVRSGGALGGYTGGTQIKQHLLAIEGVALAR
jgi:methylated-DNA-[protein]-cysteine S-methyltransferase